MAVGLVTEPQCEVFNLGYTLDVRLTSGALKTPVTGLHVSPLTAPLGISIVKVPREPSGAARTGSHCV